jgi:urease accessory protein
MHLIHGPLTSADKALPETGVGVDRLKLERRLWRAAADDGTEFGVEVDVPLKHGDVVWADANTRYIIRQLPEPVLEIPLDVAPDVAAMIGWAVGNLHFAIEAQAPRLLAPDDPALRQSLDRLGVHYQESVDVFQPHRFTGSLAGHGHAHHHGHTHHH